MERNVRVSLIHSQIAVLEGLRRTLKAYPRIEIIGEFTHVARALLEEAVLAADVFVTEVDTPGIGEPGATPDVTISITRDQEGRPLVNLTTYREPQRLAEVAIVGRCNEYRVQAIELGSEGYRIVEDKVQELVRTIDLAAENDPTLSVTSEGASQTAGKGSGELSALKRQITPQKFPSSIPPASLTPSEGDPSPSGTRTVSGTNVSNQRKWDTLGAERSGAGWRSGELPEGPVVASSPFGGLSLHLLPAL